MVRASLNACRMGCLSCFCGLGLDNVGIKNRGLSLRLTVFVCFNSNGLRTSSLCSRFDRKFKLERLALWSRIRPYSPTIEFSTLSFFLRKCLGVSVAAEVLWYSSIDPKTYSTYHHYCTGYVPSCLSKLAPQNMTVTHSGTCDPCFGVYCPLRTTP